jgi:threonyl-tRNA synthetase
VACDEDDESEAVITNDKNLGELWDMNRPLIGDCTVTFLKYDDPESKTVFSHSSAHILGAALEQTYGSHLTIGPALQSGN